MSEPRYNIGAFVRGAVHAPRALRQHAELLNAYADDDSIDNAEAYLSHFIFGAEMRKHYGANRQSVAGFVGSCWCRWLILDIDRSDGAEALADAWKLVAMLHERYAEMSDSIAVWFSGSKGFHIGIDLAHNPPPAIGFHRTARTLAEGLAALAGVKIDTSIYDINHIVRLPNTRHSKTGLYKRRIDADAMLHLNIDAIRKLAEHPAGDGIPTVRTCPPPLAEDWRAAEERAARATEERAARRAEVAGIPDNRAPRWFLEFIRFDTPEGERHATLFRAAAYATEQGCPPSFVFALLSESGCDLGLMPKDVARQIQCGIDHARRQCGEIADPRIITGASDGTFPADALDFPFGALAYAREGGRL
jgi:hypothetical protein